MPSPQTVFIVDDDQDFRESLTWLLEGAGHTVISYENAETFLALYQQQPGCLLLDVRMAGMSGLALQQELNQRGYVIPVIMITGHGDVSMAVQAMKNHAIDFIEKPFDDETLLSLVDDTLTRTPGIFTEANKSDLAKEHWMQLSKREKDVAKLVIQGLANREVAEHLDISIKTVEIHRCRVMKKMQAKRLADLMGLVPYLKDMLD